MILILAEISTPGGQHDFLLLFPMNLDAYDGRFTQQSTHSRNSSPASIKMRLLSLSQIAAPDSTHDPFACAVASSREDHT
jgi:hypothetical protein